MTRIMGVDVLLVPSIVQKLPLQKVLELCCGLITTYCLQLTVNLQLFQPLKAPFLCKLNAYSMYMTPKIDEHAAQVISLTPMVFHECFKMLMVEKVEELIWFEQIKFFVQLVW